MFFPQEEVDAVDGQEEITDEGSSSPSSDDCFKLKCAQCHMEFEFRNALHKHLRDDKHYVVDDDTPGLLTSDSEDEDATTSSRDQRRLQARQVREAIIVFFPRYQDPMSTTYIRGVWEFALHPLMRQA